MTFIFGGAYQGMEEYAREQLGADDILMLDESALSIDFSRRCIAGLERFARGCVQRGESPAAYFEAHASEWADCILIGMDFSCGIVPLAAELRFWREENGRMNNYLASRAARVVRMFCGLAQVLK